MFELTPPCAVASSPDEAGCHPSPDTPPPCPQGVITDRLCIDARGELRLASYRDFSLLTAASCLIQPAADDVVCALFHQQQAFVIAILQRLRKDGALVLYAGEQPLHIAAPTLTLHGTEQVKIHSGHFSLLTRTAHCCANTLHQVTQSLFISTQHAHKQVTQLDATEAGHISQHAQQSIVLHGRIGSIHASAALRIDGGQVHMG